MKRQETLDLENALINVIKDRHRNASFGYYGCEEVTIGFSNNGRGNEIVDFMTMDSKGIIRCYEIKVTLADLKSKAKLSFYGNYNYLVVSKDLYGQVENFYEYIPKHIGVICGEELETKIKCKRQNISIDDKIMLQESLVRSIYFKMVKYYDSDNLNKYKQMQSQIYKLTRERDEYKYGIKKTKTIKRRKK